MGRRDRKDANRQTGRWTKDEHERFMQGLLTYGKNWKLVEQVVETRSAAQVRSHAQKFFNRLDREQRKMKQVETTEPEDESSGDSNKEEEQEACQEETPQQIIALVRKNSKQDKSVNVNTFLSSLKLESDTLAQDIKKRKQSSDSQPKEEIAKLERRNSQIKCMQNLVESMCNVSEEVEDKDESYFINLVKEYKRYILNNNFINLVDYPVHKEVKEEIEKIVEKKERKKSFHLVEDTTENLEQYNNLRKKVKADSERGEPIETEEEVSKEVSKELEKSEGQKKQQQKEAPAEHSENKSLEYKITISSPKQTTIQPPTEQTDKQPEQKNGQHDQKAVQ